MDDRLLKILLFLGVCVFTVSVVYMAVHVRDAYAATHYNATTTAYAFGGTGAAGVWLQQYHVANHPLGRCVMVRQTRLGPGLGEQES